MATRLQQILELLHEELGKNTDLDVKTLESLRRLSTDIGQVLHEQHDATEPAIDAEGLSATLSARVQSLIDEFAMQHPQLAKTLSTIAEGLADMGI